MLDPARRQLFRDGTEVPLSPKAFDLLNLLAEHHERAFSKADLHQHLWPDSFVSDGSLTRGYLDATLAFPWLAGM